MHIRAMTIEDYDQVVELMKRAPGVCVRTADSREATRRFLEHNPGFSFVAEDEGKVIGCAMAGHDGRRGYLQHVVVAQEYQGKGLGRKLVEACLAKLDAEGFHKTHLDVMTYNTKAMEFWEHLGWQRRDDLVRYSIITSDDENA